MPCPWLFNIWTMIFDCVILWQVILLLCWENPIDKCIGSIWNETFSFLYWNITWINRSILNVLHTLQCFSYDNRGIVHGRYLWNVAASKRFLERSSEMLRSIILSLYDDAKLMISFISMELLKTICGINTFDSLWNAMEFPKWPTSFFFKFFCAVGIFWHIFAVQLDNLSFKNV